MLRIFLRWDVGNVTVFFISKICYRARCLRAQVMGHVVVAAFFDVGCCLAVMALVYPVFIISCGAFLSCVCVCLCILNVCAARHVVLL